MFGSAILEVAMGIVFVYLLISLIVTAITELIASFLKWRSANLWYGINKLLLGKVEDKEAYINKLYDHPLIRSLSPIKKKEFGSFLDKFLALFRPDSKGPSYIPSRTFAVALIDTVQKGSFIPSLKSRLNQALMIASNVTDLTNMVEAIVKNITDGGEIKTELEVLLKKIGSQTSIPWDEIETISKKIPANDASFQQMKKDLEDLRQKKSQDFREVKTVIEGVIRSIPYGNSTADQLNADLKDIASRLNGIPEINAAREEIQRFMDTSLGYYLQKWILEKFPETHFGKSLNVLIDESRQDIEKLKDNVEVWFNNSMDRVSGWYKRKTQFVHLVLAILITLIFNIDSVLILKSLSGDSTLRQSLVAQATKFAEQEPVSVNTSTASNQTATAVNDQGMRVIVPTDVIGGSAVKGQITSKIENEVEVKLSSTSDKIKFKEDTLKIPKAGEMSFILETQEIGTPTSVSITATYDSKTAQAVLNLWETPEKKYELLEEKLKSLNLPIGWTPDTVELREKSNSNNSAVNQAASSAKSAPQDTEKKKAIRNPDLIRPALWPSGITVCEWLGSWVKVIWIHLFGWLLTCMAISLGAPFWFDMLKKIISIRSSGKAPEEAPIRPKTVPQPHEPGEKP